MLRVLHDIIASPQSRQKGRKKKMAIIHNIDDYRNKTREQNPEEQFNQFLNELGKWESPKEESEFYRQLARENEADMREFQREFRRKS